MKFIPADQAIIDTPPLSLTDFCDLCEGRGKIESEEDYLALLPAIRRLAKNKHLLDGHFESLVSSGSSQVNQSIVLATREHFYVRAMLWPSIPKSKMDMQTLLKYAYYLPHDHNFSFMTIGYFGPGYKTMFFHSDRGHREASKGDRFGLSKNMGLQLGRGDAAIVSEYRDAHIQFPPESLSISLNLVPKQKYRFKQAFFDADGNVFFPVETSSHYDAFMEMAGFLKSEKLRATISQYYGDVTNKTGNL